jgi:hypothetical protein
MLKNLKEEIKKVNIYGNAKIVFKEVLKKRRESSIRMMQRDRI